MSAPLVQPDRPNQTKPNPRERTLSVSTTTNMEDDDPGRKQQPPQQRQNRQVSRTQCSNCGTTKTPLWRRAPNGDTICNACGLFLKARNAPRPVMELSLQQQQSCNDDTLSEQQQQQQQQQLDRNNSKTGSCPGDGHCNGTGGSASCAGCPAYNQHHQDKPLQCTNCGTRTTPLWRRDMESNIICNACGLYYKLHNTHRPITMKRTMIKRRKRSAPLPNIDLSNSTCSSSSLLAAAGDESIEKQQQEVEQHDDLENRIAEFDAVMSRIQHLRQEILLQQHTNKANRLIDLTDSLRDVVTKAEIALLT